MIKGLIGLPLMAAVGKTASAAPEKSYYVLNRFSIAGFVYYGGPDVIEGLNPLVPRLSAGSRLDFFAEPHNPYDEFAVRMDYRGIKIGYVPRSDNKHISRLLQQNATLTCRAIEVNPKADTWKMVRVEVGMLV